jgi:hypothetical protein
LHQLDYWVCPAAGDSEFDGTGIETSITGKFKITLHKKSKLPNIVKVGMMADGCGSRHIAAQLAGHGFQVWVQSAPHRAGTGQGTGGQQVAYAHACCSEHTVAKVH